MKQLKISFILFIFSATELQAQCNHHDCLSIIGNILLAHQRLHATGQIMVSQTWFLSLETKCLQEGTTFANLYDNIPWIISGRKQTKSTNSTSNKPFISTSKYTSSRFVHLQQLTSASDSWPRNPIYLQFKYGNLSYVGKPGFTPLQKMIQSDLQLITFNHFNISRFYQFQNLPTCKHTIWVGCSHLRTYENNFMDLAYGNHSTKVQKFEYPLVPNPVCIYSTIRELNVLKNAHPGIGNILSIEQFRQTIVSVYFDPDLFIYKSSTIFKQDDEGISFTHSNKSIGLRDNLANKGYPYSSLVLITKKTPENENGPFTLISWISILAAYTITAIVFGVD